MPKISVYLPDELYRQVREHGLPVSTLAQEAIEAALRRSSRHEWVERLKATPPRLTEPLDAPALLDAVREEFGA